jgi:ABC-type glycerol-3-phosphate transport system permease component
MRVLRSLLIYTPLCLAALFFAFPFYFMFVASFMDQRELFNLYPRLLPGQWRIENYFELFRHLPFARNALNTLIVTVSSTALTLFFCSLSGFAFAKYRFPGRELLFIVVVATIMMPPQITLIPLYLLMRAIGWQNTYLAVVVPGAITGFGIFLMRQYTESVLADELIDAASIDGASFVQVYTRIALPIVVPGLTVLGLLTFISHWNDFMWPLLMLDTNQMMTIPVALGSMVGVAAYDQTLYGPLIAGLTLTTLPLAALFLALQRFFVAGITSGALKGG